MKARLLYGSPLYAFLTLSLSFVAQAGFCAMGLVFVVFNCLLSKLGALCTV